MDALFDAALHHAAERGLRARLRALIDRLIDDPDPDTLPPAIRRALGLPALSTAPLEHAGDLPRRLRHILLDAPPALCVLPARDAQRLGLDAARLGRSGVALTLAGLDLDP